MSSAIESSSLLGEGLRQRQTEDIAKSISSRVINEDESKDTKVVGKTPDGTVFIVPTTHDMVSQLLDPRQPKNASDLIVLGILVAHIILLYALPGNIARPIFAIIFLFWRGCYNIGIGYLLHIQSHHKRLITWARQYSLFEKPSSGRQPRPWLYAVLKRELETKIPEDYKFEEAPIEYNTWLVFRRVVDLILMCDFTSYVLFAVTCGSQPEDEGIAFQVARWTTGLILVGFNLWVKLDAHRVVKDYAWYWGDFFYLVDQQLTFDGVFEMAPHPMYSVGYAGYYGISMMAASYNVLFISIVAHAAQFAFLVLVENPHIEKTYNPPPPRIQEAPSIAAQQPPYQSNFEGDDLEYKGQTTSLDLPLSKDDPSTLHSMIGLHNMDAYRVTDVAVVLLMGYTALLVFTTPSTPTYQVLFVLHAVAWRLWYTLGLGIILGRQSEQKSWTRHFVKWGDSTAEAWRQWKGMYYMSMTMCWVSFIAAAYKMYTFPADWAYGLVLLKHTVGAAMIALQIWTSVSIYDSLGEFGWFFGDFFFDQPPKLSYDGIYRYLNNPERILGVAGVWGAVLITNSKAIFALALLSHVATLSSIQFVEKPHMEKLYGRKLRKQAGLSKSIRRSLPPPLKQWQGRVDQVLGETSNFVEEFLDAARPKLAQGVSSFVRDTSALFSQYPARLTVTRLAPDLAGINPKDYSITMKGAHGDKEAWTFDFGSPISVHWTAPRTHSKKDWIGLYRVVDNSSRDVTRLSSQGRWIPTNRQKYDSTTADTGILIEDMSVEGGESDMVRGEMLFQGDKLFWTTGVYEFRYHHDGKHNVMSISPPFNIILPHFDGDSLSMSFSASNSSNPPISTQAILKQAIENTLLPIVQNCLDRDPEIAPSSLDERFGARVEREGKYATRVVYAIRDVFGIEFAPGVVLADGNVRRLAWRVWNAKEVLAPYSMSHSQGTNTPGNDDK